MGVLRFCLIALKVYDYQRLLNLGSLYKPFVSTNVIPTKPGYNTSQALQRVMLYFQKCLCNNLFLDLLLQKEK